jgi:hypothetical protein
MLPGIYTGQVIDLIMGEALSFTVLLSPNNDLELFTNIEITNVKVAGYLNNYISNMNFFILPYLKTEVTVIKRNINSVNDKTNEFEITAFHLGSSGQSPVGAIKDNTIGNYKSNAGSEQFNNIDDDAFNMAAVNTFPKDSTPGDLRHKVGENTLFNGLGISFIKASILSQILCLKEQDLVRIVSKNFEHFKSSGVEVESIDVEGNNSKEEIFAFNYTDAKDHLYNIRFRKGNPIESVVMRFTLNEIIEEDGSKKELPVLDFKMLENGAVKMQSVKFVDLRILDEIDGEANIQLSMVNTDASKVKGDDSEQIGFVHLKTKFPTTIEADEDITIQSNSKNINILSTLADVNIDTEENMNINVRKADLNITLLEGNVNTTIEKGNQKTTLNEGNVVNTIVKGDILTEVTEGSTIVNIGGSAELNITGDLTANVDGNTNIISSGDLTANVDGNTNIISSGDLTANVDGATNIISSGDASIEAANIKVNSPNTTIESNTTTIKATSAIIDSTTAEVKASSKATVQAPMVEVKATSKATVQASQIHLKGSKIKMGM